DQLTVGTLQVALDHVVLEVVDGLRLVLHVVVAARRRARFVLGEGIAAGHSHESEKSNSDDQLHDWFSLHCWGVRLPGFRQLRTPSVPNIFPFRVSVGWLC